LTALALLLLFVDLHAGSIADQRDSHQKIVRAGGSPSPVGHKLRVYLVGDLTRASELKKQMAGAVRAKDLPFDEVLFLDEIPLNLNEDPFLAIRLDEDGGIWTPFFATRQIKATIFYTQGRPVDRDVVLATASGGDSVAFSDATCTGQCSDGRRTVKLNTRAFGLVSLPHMRAYVAGQVAQEAVDLVTDGLPDHLNPDEWAERADELAQEKLGAHQGGTFSSFRRHTGCRGGIVVTGTLGAGADWSVMYYDADRDAIVAMVTRSELQANRPDDDFMGTPGFGSDTVGSRLYLGGDSFFTIPAGTCSFSGWQITSREFR
jgi:hypothetical protein